MIYAIAKFASTAKAYSILFTSLKVSKIGFRRLKVLGGALRRT
jgi:hypothetical protein